MTSQKSERLIQAFKDPLVKHGRYETYTKEKLLEFKNNPGFVVRDWRRLPRFRGRETKDMYTQEILHIAQNIAQKSGALFQEIRDKYHIVAPIHFIVAQNEKAQDTIFIIAENVKKFVPATEEDKALYTKQLVGLYKGMFDYLVDKSASGEDFLNDLFYLHQYVYGKRNGESEPRFHLVDGDPFYSRRGEKFMEGYFSNTADSMVGELIEIADTQNLPLDELVSYGERALENIKATEVLPLNTG